MSLIYNATFGSQTRILSLLDKAGNVISSCEVPSKELVDDIAKPLTFKATQDGSTVSLKENGLPVGDFQTSRDGGNTWSDYTLDSAIALNTGDEVSFRAKSDRSAQNAGKYFYFQMTGKIEAWHNVMSMIRTNDFSTYKSVVNFAFYRLFQNCTSLTKAPVLPATTLADSCYYDMFGGTSLTEAPALPATTLAPHCYNGILYGCTSLTKAPELPATTLADDCYGYMFSGCSSLNEVRCKMSSSYSSSQISSNYTQNWLSNVSSTGTFYTNADANWPSGTSGIPTGWTRVNEGSPTVDDITKPLTFRATQDGSKVALKKSGSPTGYFQTSRDGGNTWSDYTLNTAIALNTGDEVSFRAKADRKSAQSNQDYFYFGMTGEIEAWHNVMSLYRTNDFATYDTVLPYAFYRLFRLCTSLTKAPSLPATVLARSCYASMFSGCDSLTQAPLVLPATTLADHCYHYMFWGCAPLSVAPELPATALADYCYTEMFNGCSSLNEVHCKIPSSYSSSQISSVYATDWLKSVSATGTFYTNADANWTSGASGIPTGWTRVNEEVPSVDDPNKPLMLRAIEDNSSVTLVKNGTLSNTYQTSTNGTDWTDYTLGTEISLNKGEYVYFRRRNNPTTQSNANYVQFVMTGKVEAWHNAYSMIRSSFTNTGNSVGMFGMCYLFKGCKSLTKAPLLVNTVLEERCYASMFNGCTSLTKAPSLPATTLADHCYYDMFNHCTSLTQAPELPATTLAYYCYQLMFGGCTSLAQAPELPATTLARDCYSSMFYGCTSLTKAPSLPATTLVGNCYYEMFNGCTELKEVRIAATTTETDALNNWLYNVSATGDFYCDPKATIFPSGISGIPANWTRRNIADYPVTP